MIGSGVEKRGLVSRVWQSNAVREKLGTGFIFDGTKLAWSMNPIDREVHLIVDMDQENGRTPRPNKPDTHRVVIRQTNRVRLDVLFQYLEGRVTFDNACLEAITFLNHLLREYPATRYTVIKQNFYARGQTRHLLGSAVEAFKGVYQSMRIVHGGPSGKARLSINIDVANGTFWTEAKVSAAAVALTGKKDPNDLINTLRTQGERGRTAQDLKKMRKLHVVANHRGGSEEDKYVIERFVFQSARDVKFDKDGKMISIYGM